MGNDNETALTAAHRWDTSAASTAATAPAGCGRRPPRHDARAAAGTGSCCRRQTGACCAHAAAANAAVRSNSAVKRYAGHVRSGPRSPPRNRHARAAQSPAICASRRGGAARARGPAHQSIRPASVCPAVSCAATPRTACAGDAGSATRTGRSCAVRPWPLRSLNHQAGSAISSRIWPPVTAPLALAG